MLPPSGLGVVVLGFVFFFRGRKEPEARFAFLSTLTQP
jgi:hypothetical protein